MYTYFKCRSMCQMHISVQKPEEGIGSPGAGVIEGCELPWRYWELNLDPMEEQPVLFTTESSIRSREDVRI